VPAQHRVLVPEHQQFSLLDQVPADHQDGEGGYKADYQVDDLERHPASQPSPPPSRRWLRRSATQSSIRAAQVAALWSALQDVAAEHVAGLERLAEAYLGSRDGIEVVGREELAARLARGEVLVLDVRSAAEYAAGHIAGARSVPLSELRRQLRALPAGADVVAYCRGPYCVCADEAVRELTRRGFRARRLAGGFPEWKRAGLPIAAGKG
jgi:rhodanese-related sulfurtransferase